MGKLSIKKTSMEPELEQGSQYVKDRKPSEHGMTMTHEQYGVQAKLNDTIT